MTDGEITRGEFELLKQIVTQNQNRLEAIDLSGTRGVGALTSRVDDMVKDLAEFKTEVTNDFREHKALHKDEESKRVSARRWAITTAILALTALAGLYPLIFLVTRKG